MSTKTELIYGSAEWQVAKAHAQFLSLGLHCECGTGKREDEACCCRCEEIHARFGLSRCFDCRRGRERHAEYKAAREDIDQWNAVTDA